MKRKTMRAKLAAILTALVLVGSGSFFGNTNLLNSMALAEEEVVLQETETKAEPETETPETEAEEAGEAEPKEETPETEEETEPAGEETIPGEGEAAEEPAEAEEVIPEEEAEAEPEPETPETEDGETADPEATVPEEETEPQETEKAETEGEDETTPEEEAATEPEDKAEDPFDGEDEDEEDADPDDEGVCMIFDDDDPGTITEEMMELLNIPEKFTQAEYTGTAEIMLVNEGMLTYGDEIILKADVRDVNTDYVLLWEANDNNAQGWFTIGVGDEYRFILDQENLEREYRVVIYSVA